MWQRSNGQTQRLRRLVKIVKVILVIFIATMLFVVSLLGTQSPYYHPLLVAGFLSSGLLIGLGVRGMLIPPRFNPESASWSLMGLIYLWLLIQQSMYGH